MLLHVITDYCDRNILTRVSYFNHHDAKTRKLYVLHDVYQSSLHSLL